MAEIKLLPVLENGRPPYWNSISGFDYDLCIVIGMSFCIEMKKNVIIALRECTLAIGGALTTYRPKLGPKII